MQSRWLGLLTFASSETWSQKGEGKENFPDFMLANISVLLFLRFMCNDIDHMQWLVHLVRVYLLKGMIPESRI